MDIKTIIYTCIAFNGLLVAFAMWYVRKVKIDQRRRQTNIVKLAKEKEELQSVNSLKDELLVKKDEVLEKYRQILNI